MNKKPRPIVVAMLMCDSVVQDINTNKKSLQGLFNRINLPETPSRFRPFYVFLKLTEGNGAYDCELRCVNANSLSPILRLQGPLRFVDPNQVLDISFEVPPILFPSYGHYRFEFLCDGEPAASSRFEVIQTLHRKEKV